MNKFMRLMRKKQLDFPKISPGEMKPTDYQHNLTDLGRMHQLKMWHMENSPFTRQNLSYLQEVEELHNEINYLNAIHLMKKLALFFGAFWIWYFFLFDMAVDKFDFKKNFDLKFTNKMYNELDEGGIEG